MTEPAGTDFCRHCGAENWRGTSRCWRCQATDWSGMGDNGPVDEPPPGEVPVEFRAVATVLLILVALAGAGVVFQNAFVPQVLAIAFGLSLAAMVAMTWRLGMKQVIGSIKLLLLLLGIPGLLFLCVMIFFFVVCGR